MDPELMKLLSAAMKARQSGASADAVDKALIARGAPVFKDLVGAYRDHMDVGGVMASAGLGAAQAMTGGLADEAGAGLEALIPRAGTTFTERYRALRATESEVRNKHPLIAAGTDVGTSLLLPGPGMLKLIKGGEGLSLLQRTGRAALALGTTGALEGAARGEGTEGRVLGAGAGAGLGLAAAAAPLAVKVAGEYGKVPFKPLIRALSKAGAPPAQDATKAELKQIQLELARDRLAKVRAKAGKAAPAGGLLGPPPAPSGALLGPQPAPANPFALSPAASAAPSAEDAARSAYNLAIAAGQTKVQAVEAAKRAAGMSAGFSGF